MDRPVCSRFQALALLTAMGLGAPAGFCQEVIEIERQADFGPGVLLGVLATSRAGPIQSFVLSVSFDPERITLTDFAAAGDWLLGNPPDFVATPPSPGDPGVAGLAVILDTTDDKIDKVIPATPAGDLQTIAELSLKFRPGAGCVDSIPIELEDGAVRFASGLRMLNSLVIGGKDYYAASSETPLELLSGGVVPNCFIRGDSNDDGAVDTSDAVSILFCLFFGDLCPTCLKAGDCNDDGAIDLSDAVCLLRCVFQGLCPPPPFPDCSLDQTMDSLDCARYRSCL